MALRNPEVHYRSYIYLPLVPIFSKIYPVSSITTHLPQIHFNIIFPSLHLGLHESIFPSGFPTKTLYTFLHCSICATYPAHLSRLDLRFVIVLGKQYNACSSALCNFLYSPVLSLLAQNIFLSTLFSNTLNLCTSLKVRDQVSQTYDWLYNCFIFINFQFLGMQAGQLNFLKWIISCISHVYSAFNSFHKCCLYFC